MSRVHISTIVSLHGHEQLSQSSPSFLPAISSFQPQLRRLSRCKTQLRLCIQSPDKNSMSNQQARRSSNHSSASTDAALSNYSPNQHSRSVTPATSVHSSNEITKSSSMELCLSTESSSLENHDVSADIADSVNIRDEQIQKLQRTIEQLQADVAKWYGYCKEADEELCASIREAKILQEDVDLYISQWESLMAENQRLTVTNEMLIGRVNVLEARSRQHDDQCALKRRQLDIVQHELLLCRTINEISENRLKRTLEDTVTECGWWQAKFHQSVGWRAIRDNYSHSHEHEMAEN